MGSLAFGYLHSSLQRHHPLQHYHHHHYDVGMVLVLRPPKIDDITLSKFLIQHTEWFDAPLLAQACKCFDTENAFPHVQLLLLPSRKCFSCLELFHKTFAQSNV